MKIVMLDSYTTNPGDLSWEDFEKLGDFTAYDRTPAELTVERAKDAEIVITNNTLLPKSVLEKLPKLKYIGLLSTGYNVVDIEYAKEKNIPVCNVPTYSTLAVAQLTFALILEIFLLILSTSGLSEHAITNAAKNINVISAICPINHIKNSTSRTKAIFLTVKFFLKNISFP